MSERPKRDHIGGSGRLGDRPEEWDRYWATLSPEEKMAEIFATRRLYHEVLNPGSGSPRLERSVGGVRRLRD